MAETVVVKKKRLNYDCTNCPAYCCSIYERVEVTKRDINRLAKHFSLSADATIKRFTKIHTKARVLRRKKDPVLGQACQFLDPVTRGCTIYDARPAVCREYPARSRCSYYDLLTFERDQQDDQNVLPLIQITFKNGKK